MPLDAPTIDLIAGGIVVVLMLLGALRGRLKSFYSRQIRKHETATQAHDQIPRVVDGIERVEQKVEHVDDRMGDLKHGQKELKQTVAVLHREDVQDDPLVRERLGVEADDDILND